MKKCFNFLVLLALSLCVLTACDEKKPKNEQPTIGGGLEMDDGADSTVYVENRIADRQR